MADSAVVPDQEETLDPQPPKRRMGYWARSLIKPHIQEILKRYSLDVRTEDGGETYHLFSTKSEQHPDDIIPDFIDRFDRTSHSLVMDLDSLQMALDFMHQPVRVSMRHAVFDNVDHDDLTRSFQLAQNLSSSNQPSAHALMKHVRQKSREIAKDADDIQHRIKGQNVLRFMTTADVKIPVYQGDFEEVEECHAEEENESRDRDAWALNCEAGHADHPKLFNTADPPDDKLKTVPGFYFDPARGYILELHPSFLNQGAFQGAAQNELRNRIISALGSVGVADDFDFSSDQVQGTREIAFTADQFYGFCSEIQKDSSVSGLVQKAEFEQLVTQRQDRIAAKAQALSNDKTYLALSRQNTKDDARIRDDLNRMLVTTTQFTPIIEGAHMRKIWADYFPSQKKDMPFEDVIAEFADMRHRIETMLDQREITQEQLEAFAQEYYQTLGFVKDMADILKTASEDQNTKTVLSRSLGVAGGALGTYASTLFFDTGGATNLLNVFAYGLALKSGMGTGDKIIDWVMPSRKDRHHDVRANINAKMQAVGSTVDNLSLTGVHVVEDHMADYHQDTLSVLRKAFRQDGTFLQQTLEAGKESGGEFIDDIVNSVAQSPATQVATVLGSGFMIWSSLKGDPQAVADAVAEMDRTQGTGGFDSFIGADNSDIYADYIPPPPEVAFSCHTDVKPTPDGLFKAYKHCIFGTLVTDQAANTVSGLDFVVQEKVFQSEAADLINELMQKHFNFSIEGNEDSLFTKAARAAVKPTAAALMVANFLQNITHVLLWVYSGVKGWTMGMKGFDTAFSFLKPLGDISLRAVRAPFSAVSGALESVGVHAPFLPDAPLSAHENLFKILDADTVENLPAFRAEDLADNLGIAKDILAVEDLRKDVVSQWPEGLEPADIRMRVGGFKKQFSISQDNLADVMRAIDKLDLTIEKFPEQIGVFQPWHHKIIRDHLDSVKGALTQYLEDGDSVSLQNKFEEHLDLLSGFELRQTGQASIFNAMADQEVDEKTSSVLEREADIVVGKESRFLSRIKHANTLMGINTREDGKPVNMANRMYARVALTGQAGLGAFVGAARNVQRGYEYVGNRPWLNYGLKGTAAMFYGADAAGLLPENDVAEFITEALGTGFGVTATGTSFVVFNSGEDVLLVHTGMMTILITGGAVTSVAYNNGAKPLTLAAAEELREKWPQADVIETTKKLSNAAANAVKPHTDNVISFSERAADRGADKYRRRYERRHGQAALQTSYGSAPAMVI